MESKHTLNRRQWLKSSGVPLAGLAYGSGAAKMAVAHDALRTVLA